MELRRKASSQVANVSEVHNELYLIICAGKLMAAIVDFPRRVVIALAHVIKHLSEFSIADAFLETNFFTQFTTKAHMLLNGNTLTNLYCHHLPLRSSSDAGIDAGRYSATRQILGRKDR
jgi:hypothetical protein